MDTTVYQPKGWRRMMLWALSVVYRAWSSTIRIEMDEASLKNAGYHDEPIVIVMWHNSLFMAPIFHRRFRTHRKVFGLISASRDGGGLAYFFDKVGIGSVRGSSSRFGREALNSLIRCYREGNDITVTPDGPRGPVYVLKAGVVLAARRARSRILIGGFTFHRCWRLKTWDRFFLPVPFSRVTARGELIPIEAIPPGTDGVTFVQDRLRRLTGELQKTGTFAAEGETSAHEEARSPIKG